MNFLEQLLAEWYEYQGYFVRRNIKVGKRTKGGHDGELDIVAFNPETRHLLHLEPSADTNAWAVREIRYAKKFSAGRQHIPTLFKGLNLPTEIDQVAVFLWGAKTHDTLGGGRVTLVADYLRDIKDHFVNRPIKQGITSEGFPLLRTLHVFIDHEAKLD